MPEETIQQSVSRFTQGPRIEQPREGGEFEQFVRQHGDPAWRDDNIPLPRRVDAFLQTHARQGTTDWQQIAPQARSYFPQVDPQQLVRPYEHVLNLEQSRQRYRDWVPSTFDVLGRESIPFVSQVFSGAERNWATDAQRRLESGNPEPGDYDILARTQRLNHLYENAGFPAQVSRAIAGLPAIAGEMYATGGLAGAALPTRAGAGAAPRLGMAAGRTAITATAPSMWLPGATENAAANGGTWSDLRNLGPAYATGFVNTAVIGSLQNYGGRGTLGLFNKALIGVGEQAMADVATGFMNEKLGLKNAHYGLIADALEGKWGELGQHASIQMLTFSMLGAMHHEWGPHNPVTEASQTMLAEQSRQGQDRPTALRRLWDAMQPVLGVLKQNPNLTQPEAKPLAEAMPPGPAKKVVEAMTQALPVKMEKPAAEPSLSDLVKQQPVRTESPISPEQAAAALASQPKSANAVAKPEKLDASQRAFIENKVRQAGNLGKALEAYPGDSAVHNYAREFARQLYPAQSEAPAAPPGPPATQQAPRPPEVAPTPPAAVREPFLGPLDVALTKLRASLKKKGLSPEHVEAAVSAAREEGLHAPDMVTGYHKAETREPTTLRAIEHVKKTGEPGVYVEMDLANLGGVNSKLGNSGANEFFRKVADIVREEMARLPADSHLFRHGGDEMSALVVNGKKEAVTEAMRRAHARILEAARDSGLSEIEHPKHPGVKEKRGTGITFGVSEIGPKDTPKELFGRADKEVEARKKSVQKAAEVAPEPVKPEKPLTQKEVGQLVKLAEKGTISAAEMQAMTPEVARLVLQQAGKKKSVSMEVAGEVSEELAAKVNGAALSSDQKRVVLELLRGGLRPAGAAIGVSRTTAMKVAKAALEALKLKDPDLWGGVEKVQDVRERLEELNKLARGLSTPVETEEAADSGRLSARGAKKARESTAARAAVEKTIDSLSGHLDNPTPGGAPELADLVTNLLAHAGRQGVDPESFLRREAPEVVRGLPPGVLRELIKTAKEAKDAYANDAAHFGGDEAALRREVVRVLSGDAEDAATDAVRPEVAQAGPGQAAQAPAEATGAGNGNVHADAAAAAGRRAADGDILTPEERSEAHGIGREAGLTAQEVQDALTGAEAEARQQAAAAARAQAAEGTPAAQAARQSRLDRLRRKQGLTPQPATPGGGPGGVAFPTPPTAEQQRAGTFGGGQPEATEPSQRPLRETALANEEVNRDRVRRSLDFLAAEGVLTNQEVKDQAFAILTQDPQAGEKLVERLVAEPGTAINVVESALLLQRMVALKNQRDVIVLEQAAESKRQHEARRRGEKPDASVLDANDAKVQVLEAQLDEVERVASKAGGTEAARTLQFRQRYMAADYSLRGMIQRAERAVRGELTEAERTTLEGLHAQIKELQDKLAGMVEKGEADGPTYDDTKYRLARVKAQADSHVEAWKRSRRPLYAKVAEAVGEAASSLPRSVMASVDFVLGRQGLLPLITHPIQTGKAIPEMFRAFASEEAAQRADYDIKNRPLAALGKKAGLDLGGGGTMDYHTQGYLTDLAHRIPALGWLLKASERSAQTFLNRVRSSIFDSQVNYLAQDGKVTIAEAKVLANAVNVFSGRGPLGPVEAAGKALSYLFFAPKWTVSRFQTLLGYPLYSNFSETAPRARKLVAQEYAKMVGAFGAVGLLAALNGLMDPDPRSSSFGKIRVGNTRLDFTGGLAGVLRFLSQTATLTTKNQQGQLQPLAPTRDKNGNLQPLPYGQDSWADVAMHFARGKLAPAPATVFSVLSGSDVVGNPVTPASAALNMATPLFINDVFEAVEDLGVGKGTAASLLGLLGVSMTTYGGSQTPRADQTPHGMLPRLERLLGMKPTTRGRPAQRPPRAPSPPR